MWTTQHTADTELPAHAVWVALRDIHTGKTPTDGGDIFEIHGLFEVGTELSVTPQGQGKFRAEIIEMVEDERYADRSEFGDVVLTFRHTLVPIEGGTRVTHELVIDGAGADRAAPTLGPQISADFPLAMQSLFDVAANAAASAGG